MHHTQITKWNEHMYVIRTCAVQQQLIFLLDRMSDRDYMHAVMKMGQEEKEALMISEEERLRTFKTSWPHPPNIDYKEIARAGFYYTGTFLTHYWYIIIILQVDIVKKRTWYIQWFTTILFQFLSILLLYSLITFMLFYMKVWVIVLNALFVLDFLAIGSLLIMPKWAINDISPTARWFKVSLISIMDMACYITLCYIHYNNLLLSKHATCYRQTLPQHSSKCRCWGEYDKFIPFFSNGYVHRSHWLLRMLNIEHSEVVNRYMWIF